MPVGVQCPISSSLGGFPDYWDWLWCPGLSPVLVSIALPFAFHTFPFALICHWISIVFLLYGRRITTHSVDPPLTHFLGEFPGLGLALIPDVVVPQAGQRCTWSRKLDPNFCPGWGRTSDPWHLAAADVATRLSRTSPYIYIYKYIYIQRRGLLICRAQFSAARGISSRAAEFGFLPRNWAAELGHGIRLFAAEFDVFHSNNYFFTENDLKVAL